MRSPSDGVVCHRCGSFPDHARPSHAVSGPGRPPPPVEHKSDAGKERPDRSRIEHRS
jgi:hypothetical protein